MTRTVTDLNGNEGEYVDFDQLIAYYIKEYINLRQANIDKLYKAFIKIDQVHQGSFNYEEFKFLLPSEDPLPESIISRAFYYSLIAGSNSFAINAYSFSAACIRFGIENPCSLVQVGWDLIFPFPSIKFIVDNKDEKYSGIVNKKEKTVLERTNFLKVPEKLTPSAKAENLSNNISLEKISAFLAQHYGVIRELKKFSDQFRQIISQKDDLKMISESLERFYAILNNASEFFTFPIVF